MKKRELLGHVEWVQAQLLKAVTANAERAGELRAKLAEEMRKNRHLEIRVVTLEGQVGDPDMMAAENARLCAEVERLERDVMALRQAPEMHAWITSGIVPSEDPCQMQNRANQEVCQNDVSALRQDSCHDDQVLPDKTHANVGGGEG